MPFSTVRAPRGVQHQSALRKGGDSAGYLSQRPCRERAKRTPRPFSVSASVSVSVQINRVGGSALTKFGRQQSGACTRHLGSDGQASPHAGSHVATVSSCWAHSPLPRRGSRRGTAHGPSGRLHSQPEAVPPPRGRGTAWCAIRRTAPALPYPGLSMHFYVDAQQKHMLVARATEQGLSIVRTCSQLTTNFFRTRRITELNAQMLADVLCGWLRRDSAKERRNKRLGHHSRCFSNP